MSIALFEKLTGRQTARKKTLAERWAAAVKAIADGREPPDMDELLVATDRDVDALRQDVERLQKRRTARAALEKARAVPAERAQVEQKLRAVASTCDAAINAARGKFEQAAAPLRHRLAELDRIEKEGAAGERELHETASPSEETEAETAQLRTRRDELRRRHAEAVRLALRTSDALHAARRNADSTKPVGVLPGTWALQQAEAKAKADALEPEAEAQEAAAKDIAAEIEAADRRLREIEATRLEI
jgi:hypothetical protein